METPTYIALSRQMVLRDQMEVVANNLANANTSGFKAEMMLMSEVEIPAEKGTDAVLCAGLRHRPRLLARHPAPDRQ